MKICISYSFLHNKPPQNLKGQSTDFLICSQYFCWSHLGPVTCSSYSSTGAGRSSTTLFSYVVILSGLQQDSLYPTGKYGIFHMVVVAPCLFENQAQELPHHQFPHVLPLKASHKSSLDTRGRKWALVLGGRSNKVTLHSGLWTGIIAPIFADTWPPFWQIIFRTPAQVMPYFLRTYLPVNGDHS